MVKGDFPGSQTGHGRVNELEFTSTVATSGDERSSIDTKETAC